MRKNYWNPSDDQDDLDEDEESGFGESDSF